MKPSSYAILLCLLLSSAAAPAAADSVLHLPLGDPERAEREAPVVLDAITDARTGELLTPEELADRLADRRLVLVGEAHTDREFHRVQRRLIEALAAAGREVMIGLEMYPYSEQPHLDAWVDGSYTEEGFLRLSDWYQNWGYHWGYYRDIFLAARRHGMPMIAINAPREVIAKVRRDGFEELSEEEAAHIPRQVDTDSDQHRRLFKAFFGGDDDAFHMGMTEEQWDGMFRAQCTWDATMAHNALRALEERGGENSVMVVLVGSGHLAYGLGIQRQAQGSFDGGIVSVIPVTVVDEEDQPVTSVQASYADFLWGLPAAGDPIYPSLGVSTRSGDTEAQRSVINVLSGSPGDRAGFQVGDYLLSIDGVPIEAKGDLARQIAAKTWGDSATVRVRRGEEELALEVVFRRQADEPDEDEEVSE